MATSPQKALKEAGGLIAHLADAQALLKATATTLNATGEVQAHQLAFMTRQEARMARIEKALSDAKEALAATRQHLATAIEILAGSPSIEPEVQAAIDKALRH